MDIIFVSTKENKRINLRTKAALFVLAVLFCVALLVMFIYNIVIFTSHRVDQKRLTLLNRENEVIQREIKRMKEKFSTLTVLIDSLEQYDKRLRTYALLEPIDDDLRKMGVGGTDTSIYVDLSSSTRDELITLSQTLDNLLARSRLQSASFNDLIEHLDTKKWMRTHTPSIIPVQGWFISGYGYRIDPFTGKVKLHEGLDIAAPPGTPIIAPASGKVKFVGDRQGFGLTLEIDHGHGCSTLYAHCQRINFTKEDVDNSTEITRGDIVAYVGNTGRSTGPHLHYEVRISNVPVDPLDYILTPSNTND